MKAGLLFRIVEGKTISVTICYCQADFFSFCLVRFLCSLFKQKSIVHPACSMTPSDHLHPTHLQNDGLNLNICLEPLHTRREGTAGICMLLNSVQCKAMSSSVWMLSFSRPLFRGEGKRNNTVL